MAAAAEAATETATEGAPVGAPERAGRAAPPAATGGGSHTLALRGFTKRYGATTAVDGVDLTVERGRFLTLLGPSGSGKTTILMAVAGFVEATAGQILLDGREIGHLPPERRNFGMVFQGYALFPHLSVADNVGFPLKVRGRTGAEARGRVQAALDLVQLGHLADRRPHQLSGGQQQRVALARALVFDPDLLLLDEPLSALDKKLRADLQWELKALHQRLGKTFIYVTHDQEEALSMSDEIAILNHGRIVQIGPPTALYERPRTRFVADFLGKSNFLEGRVQEVTGDRMTYAVGGHTLHQTLTAGAGAGASGGSAGAPGEAVLIALRPEKIAITAMGRDATAPETPSGADAADAAVNGLTGRIADFSYFGSTLHFVVETEAAGSMTVTAPAWQCAVQPEPGLAVRLSWRPDASVPIAED